MSFQDIMNTTATWISQAALSETFDYRAVVNGMPGEWQGLSGHVLPGNPENDRMIGVVGKKAKEPIRIAFARSLLSSVNEGEDQVRWNGNQYTVQADLHPSDGAWWIIYCVR